MLVYLYNSALIYVKVTRGCSSVVERQLPKLNVVGSSPIIRFCTVTNYLSLVTD